MNILLYSLIFPPDVCSNAYVFADMALELINKGHSVTVITTTPHYDSNHAVENTAKLLPGKRKWYKTSCFNGAKVYHIVVAPQKGNTFQRLKTFLAFHGKAARIAKLEKITADAVLSQTPPMTVGTISKNLANITHAKSLMIVQDIWLDAISTRKKMNPVVKKVLSKLEKAQYNGVDAVCTISESMAEILKTKMKDPLKVHVIPNFVDMTIYHPRTPSDEERRKYAVAPDDFVISYVGNIGKAQDLSPLLEYADRNRDKKLKILIAGDGVLLEKYKRIVEEKKLDSVAFLGYIDRSETPVINSLSDICLVMLANHVVATSFPSKTYTIMAMGKPILITSRDGKGAGTFIQDRKLGWAVSTDDHESYFKVLDYLYTKPVELKEYGKNAHETAIKEYSCEVVVKRYTDLIDILINDNKIQG